MTLLEHIDKDIARLTAARALIASAEATKRGRPPVALKNALVGAKRRGRPPGSKNKPK